MKKITKSISEQSSTTKTENESDQKWPKGSDEIAIRNLHLDHQAQMGFHALLVDPTGAIRKKDPELVNRIAWSLFIKSIGNDENDRDCGLMLVDRIRSGTLKEVEAMFKAISKMKAVHDAAISAKMNLKDVMDIRSALIHLWIRYRIEKKRDIPDFATLARYAEKKKSEYPNVDFSPLKQRDRRTKLMKATGMSHKAGRTGKTKSAT